MPNLSLSYQTWLTILFTILLILAALLLILAALLPSLPVAAQSSGVERPGTGGAQMALYLPLAAVAGATNDPGANPLAIGVTLDANRAVTQTITIEGGELSVTATNGTRFTLTIPADALLSDEEIGMTPLSSASGLPLSGGLVAGVQIAPEGLELMQAVTLTVEGAPGFDPDLQAIGFGYHDSGEEFHLRPLRQSASGFSLTLMHFSGDGVAAGSAQEIQSQATQHAPTAPDDNAAQQSAAEFELSAMMDGWFDRIEYTYFQMDHPEIDIDPQTVAKGVTSFQVWLEMIKSLGLEKEFAAQIDQGWKDMLSRALYTILHGYVLCKDGDAAQVVKLMRLARMLQALPAAKRDSLVTQKEMKGMAQEVRDSATFELDFDSTLSQDVPGVKPVGQAHDSHLRAEKIRVQFDVNGKLVAPSQAPLVYKEFHLAGSITGCAPELVTVDGAFNLIDATMNLNNNWGSKPKLTFRFDPGHPAETITHHCPKNLDLVFEPRFWNNGFWMIHWSELRLGIQYFEFDSWHFAGTGLYAELIIDRAASEQTQYFSGTTWLTLVHAPR